MNAKQEWSLPDELTAYSIHTTVSNCEGRSLIKEALSLKELFDCEFNPGSWMTPLYLIPSDQTDHKALRNMMDEYKIEWSYIPRRSAEVAG